jgi:hypothetical protein
MNPILEFSSFQLVSACAFVSNHFLYPKTLLLAQLKNTHTHTHTHTHRHTTKLKSDIAPRLVESLMTLVVDIGLDNLRKVPVGGVDAFPEHQQALLETTIATYRQACMCRYVDGGEWAHACSCGSSGGWCLVYRGDGDGEDDGREAAGDLMLAVEGTRLGVKAYKQFESAMDRQR